MTTFGWNDKDYAFEIDTPRQVITLIEIIASWLNEERWENESRSVWLYEEIRPILIQDIINLALIYTFMCENPDVYLEFYDSY